MLTKYLNVEKKEIPHCNGFYTISIHGVVKNIYNNVEHNYINKAGNLVVIINLWNGNVEYTIAFLIAISFKPIAIPLQYWNKIGILFKDSNVLNFHPGNLIWSFGGGVYAPGFMGYKIIPGYTKYAINKAGIIVDWSTGKLRNSYKNKAGYVYFSLYSDTGKLNNSSRHRLLCLAWKLYTSNITSLDVNHIDGIPGNDSLSNLEFVTRKRNCDHAFEIGLHNTNIPVQTRNVITNEIINYYSYGNCGKKLNCDPGHIRKRVLAKNQPVFIGNLQFKLKSDNTPWRNVSPAELEFKHRGGISCGLKAFCLKTKSIIEYKSITACSKAIYRNRASIVKCLETASDRPINGYMYKLLTDNTPWKEYTEEEITSLQSGKDFKAIMVLDLKTKESHQFLNSILAAKYLGTTPPYINACCKLGYKLNQRFKLSYIVK